MAGHFKVKAITDLDNVKVHDIISESDYSTLTPNGKFVQLVYHEEKTDPEPYKVEPGMYTIMRNAMGYYLEKTSFTQDKILEDFVNTAEIEEKADCFFRNIDKYAALGIEIAKRNMLLYGPPGGGKTTALAKVCNKYMADKETAVIIFATEKFEAYEVKDFIKAFSYSGVKKLIMVMEDVGGVELAEVRRSSDPGLLSLLDNQEKTFKIPTLTIATTNFPEVFMGNLTNRPGRFDDKIKASNPDPEARVKLSGFFLKREITEAESKTLKSKRAETLTPAHIKECVIRSVIHEKTFEASLLEVLKDIEDYNKGFSDSGKGLGFN